MPRLHQIHVARIQVVSTCILCRRLHIGDKTVVSATCILYLYPDTSCSSRIHVPGVILCKRGLTSMSVAYAYDAVYECQEFGGNSDKNIERYQFFNSPFVARYIRIYPVGWSSKISMRAGLLGCPYSGLSLTRILTRITSTRFNSSYNVSLT